MGQTFGPEVEVAVPLTFIKYVISGNCWPESPPPAELHCLPEWRHLANKDDAEAINY